MTDHVEGPDGKKRKVSQAEGREQSGHKLPSITTIKKTNEVFDYMRSKRLSIADFVSAIPYVGGHGRRQEVIVQSLFQNEEVLEDLLLRRKYDVDLKPLCNVIGVKLLQEIKSLQQNNSLFRKYNFQNTNKKDQVISDLQVSESTVEALYEQAPTLTKLLNDLLSTKSDQKTSTPDSQSDKEPPIDASDDPPHLQTSTNDYRIILILSVLCYTRNKKTSTRLPTLFGLYLNSLGVTSKRGMQIFNKYGIAANQKAIGEILQELSLLEYRHNKISRDKAAATTTQEPPNSRELGKSLNIPLISPQNLINSTSKISDANFSHLFDQYTNKNTSTTDTGPIDPKISKETKQTKRSR